MAYTVKVRTLPGAPMMAEYECPEHGRFELLVLRNEHGDPPAWARCEATVDGRPPEIEALLHGCCGRGAALQFSAANIKFWSRDPVAVGRASKSDEWDPRALDTRPLAEGKMTPAEWKKWQRGISRERRHQKRLKSGRISKRIQVGGGVK